MKKFTIQLTNGGRRRPISQTQFSFHESWVNNVKFEQCYKKTQTYIYLTIRITIIYLFSVKGSSFFRNIIICNLYRLFVFVRCDSFIADAI